MKKTDKLAPMFSSRTIRAGGNSKTLKGDKAGEYQTAIMYLAPHTASLMGNVCAMAVIAGCVTGCLFKSGRAAFTPSINPARVAKTQRYFADKAAFIAEMVRDLESFVRHCRRHNVKPACRPNGTSDIPWETNHPCYRNGIRFESIFHAFPEITFYDYTKIVKRAYKNLPSNYHLTLSYSAANTAYADSVIRAARETGVNVAVVYRSKELRDSLMLDGGMLRTDSFGLDNVLCRPVINGDSTDMRFLDRKGAIVGLYAKGPAKKDTSGFVIG
jgi:hypothetical protein